MRVFAFSSEAAAIEAARDLGTVTADFVGESARLAFRTPPISYLAVVTGRDVRVRDRDAPGLRGRGAAERPYVPPDPDDLERP